MQKFSTVSSASRAQPSPEETGRLLATGLLSLDAERATSYADLSVLASAKAASLHRERALLVQKYGAADPRVAAAGQRLARQAGFQRDLNLAHVIAATPTPAVDARSYVFHGFVRNRRREPLPKLTVALYNEKGEWLRELGYGCTDEHGYFQLRFERAADPKAAEAERKKAAEAAAANAAAGKEATAPEAGAAARKAGQAAAEIRVYDANQKLLHREADPLYPAPGRVDYRTIILDREGDRCTPPPDATDNPPPAPKPRSTAPAPAAASVKAAPVPARPTPYVAPPPAATPPPATPPGSTPLENVKGIGPVIARRLRAAGIPDLEAFLATPGDKLVKIAGFDAKVVKQQLAGEDPAKTKADQEAKAQAEAAARAKAAEEKKATEPKAAATKKAVTARPTAARKKTKKSG